MGILGKLSKCHFSLTRVLGHATPVAGDSRPRPVGDPYGAYSQSLSVLRRGIGG